jgi:hypothetical protein
MPGSLAAMNDLERNAEIVSNKARKAADELTYSIDKANAERKLTPLIESRELFVFMLASQFAKMVMRRVVIEPIKR